MFHYTIVSLDVCTISFVWFPLLQKYIAKAIMKKIYNEKRLSNKLSIPRYFVSFRFSTQNLECSIHLGIPFSKIWIFHEIFVKQKTRKILEGDWLDRQYLPPTTHLKKWPLFEGYFPLNFFPFNPILTIPYVCLTPVYLSLTDN